MSCAKGTGRGGLGEPCLTADNHRQATIVCTQIRPFWFIGLIGLWETKHSLPAMNRVDLMKKAKAAAEQLLATKGYVSVVDVLMAMGRLSKADYERWRFRQIPYLETVLLGSLNQHSFLCRELGKHARQVLNLKPSRTAYVSWGKGPRQPLRFSKFNTPAVEALFSTHYVGTALTDAKRAQRNAIPQPVLPKGDPVVPPSPAP